jgi:hypothetical protein
VSGACRQRKKEKAMTESQTAKIYQFPIRNRATEMGRRDGQKRIADLAAARLPYAETGSGWYHDAAIQEAEQAHKR